jgi:holo-[acyl-carrier protein] synthase
LYKRKGELFLERIYTKSEMDVCLSKKIGRMESLAARFAAKEAVSKALGTGIWRHGIRFTDIEIVVDETGKPSVLFHGNARVEYERIGGLHAAVSISHDGDQAVAMCVIECSEPVTGGERK